MNKKSLFFTLFFSLIFSTSLTPTSTDSDLPKCVTADGSSGHSIITSHIREGNKLSIRQTVVDSVLAPGSSSHMGLGWDGTYLWHVTNETTPIIAFQFDTAAGTVNTQITTSINYYVLGCTYLNGSLWIQEWWSTGITYEINPFNGNIISSFTSPAGTDSRGLANDGTHLWIFSTGGSVNNGVAYQVNTTGTVLHTCEISSVIQWPMDASFDYQRGTFFVIDNGTANNIKELDLSGSQAVLIAQFVHPGAVYTPEGITYDGQYLWTTALDAAWIWKIDIGDPPPPPPENILFVDDDGGSNMETYWESSFANLFYIPDKWVVTDSSNVAPDSHDLSNYTIVVWTTGGEYSNTLTAIDTTEIGKYLNSGGKFWLSGQDVLYDMGYISWMHLSTFSNDQGCSKASGIDAIMSPFVFQTTGGAFSDYADYIQPDGISWSSIIADSTDTNSVAMDTSVGLPYFLYFNSFGWENINSGADRDSMMKRVLTWIGYPPDFPIRNVGTTAIIDPEDYIMPNTTINPKATYRNFGETEDTFDVYFIIDSSGTNVYLNTDQIILQASKDTTFTFSQSWTSGPSDGITYEITTYTFLSGDINASNDTLRSTTTTRSSAWKIYSSSMPQPTYYHACVYSDITGIPTVYSLGGNPAFGSIFEFDCHAETWSTSSVTLNHETQRTAATLVNGKIYVLGGADVGFNAHSYNQEYDPVAGTVTDRTNVPTARYFLGALSWRDTLIYTIGGQSGITYYNVVEIYDPATNSWQTGTPLPITNRSFACGISGDLIYVSGGYNGSYIASTYIGEIDPLNPTSITWSMGPDIPVGSSGQPGRSRLQGTCSNDGKFFFTGGDDNGSSYPAFDTWYYDPDDLNWHQCPDKPTAISSSQCAVFVPSLDGGTFLCSGGYNVSSGSPTNATEGLVNIGTGIEENPVNTSLIFGLYQNVPNPVQNGKIKILYTIIKTYPVTLKIYDSAGRLVKTLIDRNEDAGVKNVYWDCTDNNHQPVSAGVYFCRLTVDSRTATNKIVVVR